MTARAMTLKDVNQRDLFGSSVDVCERKHGGNAESQAAFERLSEHLTESRQDVLFAVSKKLDGGATSKEVADALGKPLNAISGRLTELAREGWIERTGERRDGAAVWRAV